MKIIIDKQAIVYSAILTAITIVLSVSLTFFSVLYSTVEPARLVENLWVALPIAFGLPPFVAFPISYKTFVQTRMLKIANDKLRQLIRYDQLTGLLTRAKFFEEVEQTQMQKSAEDYYNAVFFMDLDHFKNINDEYGHAAGDEVLRQFGALLSGQMHDGELAGRLGGEEFAMFIPDCTPRQAEKRANSISRLVENQIVLIGGAEVSCTVSIGVFVGSNQTDLDTMLSKADALLYEAKEGGRNRVVARNASRLAA